MDTRVPAQMVSLYSWRLKSIASPTQLRRSKMNVFKMFTICIFPRQRKTKLVESSCWSHWPHKGHGSHLRACDRVEREILQQTKFKFVRVLCLRKYGLTLAKPWSGIEVARQSVVRTTALVSALSLKQGTGSC